MKKKKIAPGTPLGTAYHEAIRTGDVARLIKLYADETGEDVSASDMEPAMHMARLVVGTPEQAKESAEWLIARNNGDWPRYRKPQVDDT